MDVERVPEDQCAHTGITWKLCHNHTNAGVVCGMDDQRGVTPQSSLERANN